MFMPTTVIDVYRDTDTSDTNVFGDPVETGNRAWKENVPASIALSDVSRSTLAELSEDRVATYSVRVSGSAELREGDRIRDRKSGLRYQVREISPGWAGMGASSARMVCVRVGP